MTRRLPRRCPIHDHRFSRREFFGATAGLAIGAGASPGLLAQGNPHVNSQPRPIPGGVSPFGILVHHFPIAAPGTPLANISELSQITDFNGFVGLNRIRGAGSGTGFPSLAYQADIGFMAGEYVAVDGKQYNGTFGFI